MKTVNIETGMPTAETAKSNLSLALRKAKADGYAALKVIHGYGSSGRGGVIKSHVQSLLAGKKASGLIRGFVKGEDFSPFSDSARKLLDLCPELARDSDYNRTNHGVTIVLL